MKKVIILSAFTVAALATAIGAPQIWENSLKQVNVISADVVKHTDTVSAAGEVVPSTDGGLEVSVLISENDISKVKVGQAAIITGNAFPNAEYTGKVSSIAPSATKYNNGGISATAVMTTISFDECDDNIRQGYTAKAEIFTSDPMTIAVLPYEAIRADDSGNEYVYVFENGTAVKRDIVTGIETRDGVEILSGLSFNDRVIIGTAEELGNGEFVVLKERER